MRRTACNKIDVSIDRSLNLTGSFCFPLSDNVGGVVREIVFPSGCIPRKLFADGGQVGFKPQAADLAPVVIPLPPDTRVVKGEFETTAPGGNDDYIRAGHWHPRMKGPEASAGYQVSVKSPDEVDVITSAPYEDGGFACWNGPDLFGLIVVPPGQAEKVTLEGVELVRVRHKSEAGFIDDLDVMANSFLFYRELFGFFPWKRFVVVPGRKSMTGGVPVAGAMAAVHRGPLPDVIAGDYRPFIIAHEMAHVYFGWDLETGCLRRAFFVALGLWADGEFCRTSGYRPGAYRFFRDYYHRAASSWAGEPLPLCEIDVREDSNLLHGWGLVFIDALEDAVGKLILRRAVVCLAEKVQGQAWRPEQLNDELKKQGADVEKVWRAWVGSGCAGEVASDGV